MVADRDRDVFTVNPNDIPNTVNPFIERLKQGKATTTAFRE